MRILAAVPLVALSRLRSAVAGAHQVLGAATWAQALAQIRSEPVELGVVDPLLEGRASTWEIEHLRANFPSLPLVVYTALTPETAAALLRLGASGIKRIVLQRFDDYPGRLIHTFQEVADETMSERVVQLLGPALARVPEELREAIHALVRQPDAIRSVSDLARVVRADRRTCERWFQRAGLPAPRGTVMAMRLLYAHQLLRDPGYTIEDVAQKLRYSNPRTFQAHVRQAFGVTAGEMRLSLSTEALVHAIVTRYLTPAAGAQQVG